MGRDWTDCDEVWEEDAVGVYSEGRMDGKYRWKKIVWRMPVCGQITNQWIYQDSRRAFNNIFNKGLVGEDL